MLEKNNTTVSSQVKYTFFRQKVHTFEEGILLPPSVIVGKQTALCVGGSRGYLAQAE